MKAVRRDLPPLRVGLIIAVPQAPTLVSGCDPEGFLIKPHVRVAKENVCSTVVPVSHPDIAQRFDDVREGNINLIGNVGLGLGAKDGINERWTIAHCDHLSRRHNPVGTRWLSRTGCKI